ncbi:MAG: hypothetical protein OEX02_00780 [Cyclobacteriaceae bacterium]|nr:hypothetical protein [Cyclobacteriaceae bacterium]
MDFISSPVISKRKKISVLIAGNNPVDLSNIYEHLYNVRQIDFNAEVAFDLHDLFKKADLVHPDCIVIDDNISEEFGALLVRIKRNHRTKNIPLVLITNDDKFKIEKGEAKELIEKSSLSKETLSQAILGSLNLHDFKDQLLKRMENRKKVLAGMRH